MENLTILIPAYNEAKNVFRLDAELTAFQLTNPNAIVTIINDGSTDETEQMCKQRGYHVMNIPHGGKAAAISAGIMACTTAYAIVADFDMSTPLTYAGRFHNLLEVGYEIVLGSRGLSRPGAPLWRKGISLATLAARRLLLGLHWVDTQCGFKGFDVDAARRLLDMMRVYGPDALKKTATGPATNAGFDMEMLYLADQRLVIEIPVTWKHQRTDRVRPLDVVRGISDIFAIRRAWGAGTAQDGR